MSDYTPFEIRAEIIKKLPIKSLIHIRSVCKTWKSLIDSADFINNYSSHMQYLLARYKHTVDIHENFVLIAEDHTSPHNGVSLNSHHLVNTLKYSYMIGSSHGLLCLYGDYQQGHDGPFSAKGRAVIWNPSIRKAVAVDVPNVSNEITYDTVIGFGVCRETNDPKIVKITHVIWSNKPSVPGVPWEVEVFALSTGVWRRPYSANLPCKSIEFDDYNKVVIDGMHYWLATDMITVDGGYNCYPLIISFDMTSEEFGEVNLPDALARHRYRSLSMYKLRESLVVLEHNVGDDSTIFGVWMMEDGVSKSFTKLFTIDLPGVDVLEVYVTGFRETGKPIIDSASRLPKWTGSLAVYEPYSKSITRLGVGGEFSYFEYSYVETLLLL